MFFFVRRAEKKCLVEKEPLLAILKYKIMLNINNHLLTTAVNKIIIKKTYTYKM